MDPNVFDGVQQNDAVKKDLYWTTDVVKKLYQLKGGDKLLQQRKNEDRLLKLDRYYIAKYKAQTRVLKSFIFFCCLALVGSILLNKGLITSLTYTVYAGLLGIVMLYVISRDIINIFLRDSTNFDEYDYSLFYTPVQGTSGPSIAESNIPTCPS
jgi:hypothetical protein